MSAFLREIPLLVWLAVCFAAALVRRYIVEPDAKRRFRKWRMAKEPGSEIPIPPPHRNIAWRVNLRTGAYRRIF